MSVVPLKHHGRLVAAVVLVVVLGGFVMSMVTNPRFKWNLVAQYLTNESILNGLLTTVWLTVAAMAIGIVLGTIVALMRISDNPVLSTVASGYVFVFRGTPLLVQLIFWYNLSALYPTLTLGFPVGPSLAHFDANKVITVYVAALLGLGLNEGAYMSEIVRSGLAAVPGGQREAAQALGLSSFRVMTRIILPQAMRVIVPPTGNQLIGMLKTTSLVSVIAMEELLYSAQLIYTTNFQTIPLLIVASTWYLVLTTVLSIGQNALERHFGKSDRRTQKSKPMMVEEATVSNAGI
ncbi:amino acid ABC transporter permease [Paraburkholderia lycopersici]|uniref:Glutamate/aspartate import permease protein GltK n=1 Tax=Paraburkholderia lycopersici TaxID=416944 RepID=A0A1G6TIM9_9BURK|nr:amino acid ABC transporter permease [Paraburkholderia lycopersici]SDD28287.1 polar amino acid transport system permease protein [Paraburkholderia lycopersici]